MPSSSSPAAALPKNLFGYEVLDFLGQGAGSTIYLVSHPQTHQIYALKHVVRKVDKDDRFIDQLRNEFEVGKHITSDGLRKSVDFKANTTLLRKTTDAMLVMELVDGTPLEVECPRNMIDLVDTFLQTAHALVHLHSLGFVHCDLKPNNILRAGDGKVKVIDLGQACKVGTKKERIQGTPDFISPEQVRCQEVSAKTDVFNFGATMYWCLSGGKKLPTLFTLGKGENSFLVDEVIPSPRQNNPQVPEPLSNLVMDCVKTLVAKRPDMAECIRRLELVQHVLRRAAQPRPVEPAHRSGAAVSA